MGGWFLVQNLSFTVYCCFFCELLKICVSTLPILLGSECSASSQLVLGVGFFFFFFFNDRRIKVFFFFFFLEMVTDCSYFFVSGKEIVLDFFFLLLFIEYLPFPRWWVTVFFWPPFWVLSYCSCREVCNNNKKKLCGWWVGRIILFFYSLVKAGFLHSCKVLHF